MKIKTTKDGKLYIDDIEKEAKDLTVELLEEVVSQSLNNGVEYIFENDGYPLTQFFMKIKEETADDSSLKIEINRIDEEIKRDNDSINAFTDVYELND